MKRLAIIGAALLLVFCVEAQARQFAGNGQPACLTESLLDQMIDAAVSRNQSAINYLLNNGCIIPRPGIEVSPIDVKFLSGKAHVRVFLNGRPVELWTTIEALSR